jgi:hypothetical protein
LTLIRTEHATYASEAGHWYAKDGTPTYEVLDANGNPRKTTLADARKLNLVPSVTTIIKCAAAPGLEAWKRNNPDWQKLSGDAADLGSTIHGCIECHLVEKPYDSTYRSHVMGALDALSSWCGLDQLLPERSFAHSKGYGGKCDIHKAGFVADFKSKDFGADEFPKAWENHAMQLAAYREGFGMPKARGAIIYVSTQVPGLSRLVEVPPFELDQGWDMFCGLLDYWKAKTRLKPRGRMQKATRWIRTVLERNLI